MLKLLNTQPLVYLDQPATKPTQSIQVSSRPLYKGHAVGQILELKTLPLLPNEHSIAGLSLQALQLVDAGEPHLHKA